MEYCMRMIVRNLLCVLSLTLILMTCSGQNSKNSRSLITDLPGPRTENIDTTMFEKIFYVSQNAGSDVNGIGTAENPWQSIQYTLSRISDASETLKTAIFISSGEYKEPTIDMKEYVFMYGGFEDKSWRRDITKNRTVIRGSEKRRIFIGKDNTLLDGFVIIDGLTRGKGAGIFCEGTSPTITNNVFMNNKTLRPDPWQPKYWHELTHDGGAIHCEHGASPIIEHNLFLKNYTENGRGAAVSFYKKCSGTIAHNVFMQNVSGLDDIARSSDGGAVSVFDWCDPLIENNVFIENEALANNDAGAMFVALWSSPKIRHNLFIGNQCGDDAGALFVGGQEHRYDRPLDPLPSEQDFYVSISENVFVGNSNPSKNSGAMRFTMESRGEFVNNIVAHNHGIYFQRSEVRIMNNTILDNFLFVETKEGLQTGLIQNTILWANVDIQTPVTIKYCDTRSHIDGEGNFSADPLFEDDWIELSAAMTHYSHVTNQTEIYVPGINLERNALANRVVNDNDRWGVIHSNDMNLIRIWGDFSDKVSYKVLPTYSLSAKSPCIDRGSVEYAPTRDFKGNERSSKGSIDVGADEYHR